MEIIVTQPKPEDELSETPTLAGADIIGLLGDASQPIVHEREIVVAGQRKLFLIKQLSMRETTEVDAKKYRYGKNGQLVRDVAQEEINGTAWIIQRCILTNTGTADKPNYIPLWSIEQIRGTQDTPGLMDNPSIAAQSFINELVAACWDVNPGLNPIAQAQAMSLLGSL